MAVFDEEGKVMTVSVRVEPVASTPVPAMVGMPKPAALFLNWNDHAFVKVRHAWHVLPLGEY